MNPLYNSKLEIKQFYENEGAREPGISLESPDIRECENPLYDAGPSPNKRHVTDLISNSFSSMMINTREHFTSCVVFFEPRGGCKKCEQLVN